MYLRGSDILRLAVGVAALALCNGSVRAAPDPIDEANEAIGAFLRDADLSELEILHFEALLEEAEGSARRDIGQRLARAYAALMEQAESDERRAELEARSSALLQRMPEIDSLDLRLSLARAEYTRAEAVAERTRLRLADEAEVLEARRKFGSLAQRLDDIAQVATQRVRSFERQEEQVGSTELIERALADARRHRSMAHYLAGWASYYSAELERGSASSAAIAAQRHFGKLLNARPDKVPTIDRVPLQMLEFDHVARSAIGVGLCESLRGDSESALEWLDMLDDAGNLPEPIEDQLPAWRIVVLARAGDWGELSAYARGELNAETGLSTLLARLIAVLALEGASPANADLAVSLAQTAMGSLATEGQIGQLLDIADDYFDLVRTDDAPERGFLANYLRGLRAHEQAREQHEASGAPNDQPTPDADARRGYEAAARFLERALQADDASRYARARGGALLLQGLAGFFASQTTGQLEAAAGLLEQAGEALRSVDLERAGNAHRLAVRAIELALEREPAQRLERRRAELIDAFLTRYRAHPAAASFLYTRATSGTLPPAEAARDLLSIPDSSPVATAAHHEAARLLYQLYVNASGAARQHAALRFLEIGGRLLDRDRGSLYRPDEQAAERAIVNARRVLECELSLPDPDRDRAEAAYDLLALLYGRGSLGSPEVVAEMAYRGMQLAVMRGDIEQAEESIELLAEHDPDLAARASRQLLVEVGRNWNARIDALGGLEDAALATQQDLDETARVIELVRRALSGMSDTERALSDPASAQLHMLLARAHAVLWIAGRGERDLQRARGLYDSLIEAQGSNERILRDASVFAIKAQQFETALTALRGLLAGQRSGEREWFRTKTEMIETLERVDPDRARDVLTQHVVLYPDLAPEPYGARLRDAARRLRVEVPEGAG